jgi:hypothetical protein
MLSIRRQAASPNWWWGLQARRHAAPGPPQAQGVTDNRGYPDKAH